MHSYTGSTCSQTENCSNLFFAEGFCGSPGQVYAGLVVRTQPRVILVKVPQSRSTAVAFCPGLGHILVNYFVSSCHFLVMFQMKLHRTSIMQHRWQNLGIAQTCLCKPKYEGGVYHQFGAALPSLQKYHAIWDIAAVVSQHRAMLGH